MIQLFRRYVLGGETGTREGAWLLVILWCGGFGVVAWREAQGSAMPLSGDLLTVAFPVVGAIWAAAHGLQKVIDAGWMPKRRDDGLE